MEQHRHRIIIINTMEKVQVHHRLQQEMQETTMIIIIPHICNIFSLLLAFCRFFSSSPYSFLYLHLLHTLHSVLFFSILCDTVKKIIIIKTNKFSKRKWRFPLITNWETRCSYQLQCSLGCTSLSLLMHEYYTFASQSQRRLSFSSSFFLFCFDIWWWTLTRINQNKTELGMNLWYFSLAVIHGQVKEYHHVVLLNKICGNVKERENIIALNIRDCSGSAAIGICFLRQSYLCYVPTEEGNQSSEKDQDYLPLQIIDRLLFTFKFDDLRIQVRSIGSFE